MVNTHKAINDNGFNISLETIVYEYPECLIKCCYTLSPRKEVTHYLKLTYHEGKMVYYSKNPLSLKAMSYIRQMINAECVSKAFYKNAMLKYQSVHS